MPAAHGDRGAAAPGPERGPRRRGHGQDHPGPRAVPAAGRGRRHRGPVPGRPVPAHGPRLPAGPGPALRCRRPGRRSRAPARGPQGGLARGRRKRPHRGPDRGRGAKDHGREPGAVARAAQCRDQRPQAPADRGLRPDRVRGYAGGAAEPRRPGQFPLPPRAAGPAADPADDRNPAGPVHAGRRHAPPVYAPGPAPYPPADRRLSAQDRAPVPPFHASGRRLWQKPHRLGPGRPRGPAVARPGRSLAPAGGRGRDPRRGGPGRAARVRTGPAWRAAGGSGRAAPGHGCSGKKRGRAPGGRGSGRARFPGTGRDGAGLADRHGGRLVSGRRAGTGPDDGWFRIARVGGGGNP